MKKVALTVAVLTLGLAACQPKAEDNNTVADNTADVAANTADVAANAADNSTALLKLHSDLATACSCVSRAG